MKKFLLSIAFCCILLLSYSGVKADVGCCIANYNKNYTLSRNGYTDIVRVAKAQIDRSRGSFGYSGYWCAAFVNDCAMLAGQSDAIPFQTGKTHDCGGLLNAVTEAGGWIIYDGAVVSSVNGAKEGDLIFYYGPKEDGTGEYGYLHVGIMIDSSTTIEGNLGDQVKYSGPNKYSRPLTKITVVRPAYDVCYPCTPDSNPLRFIAVHARDITNTSAVITTAVGGYVYSFDDHGYRFGTSPDNLIMEAAYGKPANGSSFFFNLKNLSPGTKYYYQLFYYKNGAKYTSDWHTFTTTGSVAVTGVTVAPAASTLNIGESVTLTASITPTNATNKTVTWASSNPAVATVTGGIVKAIAPGTATITATAANSVSGQATVTVNAPTHSLLNISCLIDGKAAAPLIPGTFDLYLNDELTAQGVSSYSAEVPIGASYAVRNITAQAGYTAETTGIIGSIIANHPAVHLNFTENDTWIYADTLPEGITPELYNIEYRLYEEKTATSSPGTDWVRGELISTSYTASGAPYESDLPLATSDTRQLTDWYYFHWCGSSQAAEHYATDKYFHFDRIPDRTKVIVADSAVDQIDSRYVYYNLNWLDGSKAYCKTGITCDNTYGSHAERSYYWYKMYIYQDYTAVNTYRYTRDTGWTSSIPTKYSQVRYSPRFLLSLNISHASGLPGTCIRLTPEETNVAAFVWTSSNPAVASVEDGVVTLLHPGYAVISCSDAENPSATAECTVVVHAEKPLTLPRALTAIEDEAFTGINAAEVVLPQNIASIDSGAFSNCQNLVLIYIPDSVSVISANAFQGSEQVAFLCSDGSYAAQFADAHGIPHISE